MRCRSTEAGSAGAGKAAIITPPHRRGIVRLAIVFWIYKDLPVCASRAKLLRELNPNVPIYCLYGGLPAEASRFRHGLSAWIDDFCVFDEPRSQIWKWLHGDQMIVWWYRNRGIHLEWDTVFIAQWDLLLLDPLIKLCRSLEKDQLLLPGLRPVREVMRFWWWVRPGERQLTRYLRFIESLDAVPADPLCCLFITAALPRKFLEQYKTIPKPDLGFLEYKIPIYAQAWGFDFCRQHPFQPAWLGETRFWRLQQHWRSIHAQKQPVSRASLMLNMMFGKRVFHPYVDDYPSHSG
jgi:hypothetical protein